MKIAAIIAEYNPFHLGHEYHIRETKKKADAVIVIMSGNFVQRGAPAICDKYSRAMSAVKAGVDLVLELPAVYATQTADIFAHGAVNIIDNLNVVKYISFGAENPENLKPAIVNLLADESPIFKEKLKFYLNAGFSYPTSRTNALRDISGLTLSSKPNDLLGLEYLKHLRRIKSDIVPLIFKRSDNYNDASLKDNSVSALAIRNYIFKYDFDVNVISKFVSLPMLRVLCKIKNNSRFLNIDDFFTEIFTLIIRNGMELNEIFEMSEGLEYRFEYLIRQSDDIDSLLCKVKTKRYPMSKLNRILINILLNIKKSDMNDILKEMPSYTRVLAFNSKGRKILKECRKQKSKTILIPTASTFFPQTTAQKKAWQTDVISDRLYYAKLNLPIYYSYIKKPMMFL